MKKRIACTLMMICMGIALASCSDQRTDSAGRQNSEEETSVVDTHSDDGRDIVGISMPSRLLERWQHDGAFLKKSFENEGYDVILKYADDLIDDQMGDINDMIDAGADIILIAPIDGSSLKSVLKNAKAHNVTVIAYDRLILKSDNVSYYVSFDNYRVGAIQGEYVEKTLKLKNSKSKTYNIEITAGDSADNNATYFYNGMYDVISKYIENGALVIPSSQQTYYQTATSSWSTQLANERMVGLLNSYYVKDKRLDACICSNDSTALGVTEALVSDYNKTNKIIVTGQDCDEANLKNLIDGRQSMDIYKNLHNEAIVAVDLVNSLFKGQEPAEELVQDSKWDFECVYDTKSYNNGVKDVPSYLLQPVPVTKDNIQKELIDTGHYKYAKDGYPKAVE